MRRSSWVASLSIIAFASTAHAGAPTPDWCTVPARLNLVGVSSGLPDPLGTAVLVVRRFTSPVPSCPVVLDFSECSDVRLSSDGLPAGQTLDCTTHQIRAFTDLEGRVTFDLVGASVGAPRTLPSCLKIYANGMPLHPPIVSTFDLDGRNGVDPLDLSIAFGDMNSGSYRPRSDYDGDGDVDPLDLSMMVGAMNGGGSTTSGAFCAP